MSRLFDLRKKTPRFAKVSYRLAGSMIPYRWRQGREYRRTVAFLRDAALWSPGQRRKHLCRSLQHLVRHCGEHVPYYRTRFDELGVEADSIRTPEDLCRLPFTDAATVAVHGDALTAENIPWYERSKASTGGTTGAPLPLLLQKRVTYQRNQAYLDYFMQWHGWQPGGRMLLLRNDVLPDRRTWDYSVLTRKLRLDPFKLTPSTVSHYLDVIIDSGIEYLHTYPSAAATLFRLAQDAGDARRIPVRRIFVTSENIYPGQREFLEASSGAKVFSMYGHSESCVFACECSHASGYHVFPHYGLCELIDGNGHPIDGPGVRGEIVGTGFNNLVMPLVRYRTADFTQYVGGAPCACGCPYPRVGNIQGRWLQEMILRPDGARVSITALNMHSEVFNRVRKFQFIQEEREGLRVHVVPNKDFTAQDEIAIKRALAEKIGPSMRIEVRQVDDIPTTRAGKFRYLVQKLDVGMGPDEHRD